MDLCTSILVLVGALVLCEVIGRIDIFTLPARVREYLSLALGKRIPQGRYVFEGQIGIGFGHDDATMVLRLPVAAAGGGRTVRHVGVTDEATEFRVNGKPATPDQLLEAYDDEVGPIEIHVFEPGRIARIGISRTEEEHDDDRPSRD